MDKALDPELAEQLLEVAIDQVKTNPDPFLADLVTGDVDGFQPEGGRMPMTSSNASDRVVVYATDTGEPREILKYMLAKTLKKTRDGKPAFALHPPKAFKLGEYKCYMHPEHEQRAFLDSIGLTGKTCASAHLASAFDQLQHFERRHKREHAVWKEARDRQEREEDRRLQREQMELMRQAIASSQTGRGRGAA